MAHTLTVDVVVFNYTPKALADIWVQDHYVGGFVQEYGPGGTGGGIYCCIEVKPGPTHVRWEYDRSPSDTRPDELFKRDVIGVIPKPHGAYKYLGVHIYPDDHVEFTLSRDIPDEKKKARTHGPQERTGMLASLLADSPGRHSNVRRMAQ